MTTSWIRSVVRRDMSERSVPVNGYDPLPSRSSDPVDEGFDFDDDADYDDDDIYFTDKYDVVNSNWSNGTTNGESAFTANGHAPKGSNPKNGLHATNGHHQIQSTKSAGREICRSTSETNGGGAPKRSVTKTNGHKPCTNGKSDLDSDVSTKTNGCVNGNTNGGDTYRSLCETVAVTNGHRKSSAEVELDDDRDLSPTFDMRYISSLYQLCYDTVDPGTSLQLVVDDSATVTPGGPTSEPTSSPSLTSENETDDSHRRNNREEIRRKLAMGSDNDDYYGGERMSRKPSLQSRLQSGMNLQICFMNETVPDQDGSTVAEDDAFAKRKQLGAMPEKEKSVLHSSAAPGLSSPGTPEKENLAGPVPLEEATDILSKQAKLQAEARLALAQAKQMAHMQMEIEKQRKKKSPIAEMVGIPFPDGRHKVSRQALSEMNVAQLQVIVNDLHTQIENLNEELVRLLLERDDLHMEQDSMLVDIEDLTRYL